MNKRVKYRFRGMGLGLCLVLAFLAAIPALARERLAVGNLRVSHVGRSAITVKWEPGILSSEYKIYLGTSGGDETLVGTTRQTGYNFRGLRPGKSYIIIVSDERARLEITVETRKRLDEEESGIRETTPPDTCSNLPDRFVVNGYTRNTQCQVVSEFVVGNMELSERGFIDAVDVWSFVPDGVEVCFRNAGSLVFLDADYAPRMVMELEAHDRDGMTCGTIDREGTVVLLNSAAQPVENDSLLFDPIPLSDCQIKLTETLYLRAAPGGEIIGLVWLNSEVPVFEINGYWYKVEFEGTTGYVSRYYRKVLWGSCG